MMQTCSPVVKYKYNSNSNLLSSTLSRVQAETSQVSWNRSFTDTYELSFENQIQIIMKKKESEIFFEIK